MNRKQILAFLNSRYFQGPFSFGLSQECPVGWDPVCDYEWLRDSEFGPGRNTQDTDCFKRQRIDLLFSEISAIVPRECGQLDLSLFSILSPSEWRQAKSSCIFPMIFSRPYQKRLLRVLFLHGIHEKLTLEENWNALIEKAGLTKFDQRSIIDFLNTVYTRCKLANPKLPYKHNVFCSGLTEWIPDAQISMLTRSLKLLCDLRKLDLSDNDCKHRLSQCPKWPGLPGWWTVHEAFLLEVVRDVGFSSYVEFFLRDNSPFAKMIPNIDELKATLIEHRKREESLEAIDVPELVDYEFLKDPVNLFHWVEMLVGSCRMLGVENMGGFTKDDLILVNPGFLASDNIPYGYCAFRAVTETVLCGCWIAGIKGRAVYMIRAEKWGICANGRSADEAYQNFKVSASVKGYKSEAGMTGVTFFGLQNEIVMQVCDHVSYEKVTRSENNE